jgi:hypothetical protein
MSTSSGAGAQCGPSISARLRLPARRAEALAAARRALACFELKGNVVFARRTAAVAGDLASAGAVPL